MNKQNYNGIDALFELFHNDEKLLYDHIIKSTLFFDPEIVKKQCNKLCQDISNDIAIPARYSEKKGVFKIRDRRIKSYSRAEQAEMSKDPLNIFIYSKNKVRVIIDGNGNAYPYSYIKEYTGHIAENKKGRTIFNYSLTHIWGNAQNPLYYSSMWNYCLMPVHLYKLTDNRSDEDIIVKINSFIKAVMFLLYDPKNLMKGMELSEIDMPEKQMLDLAQQYIDNRIHYLSIILD